MLRTEPSFCIYSTEDGKEEIIVGNESLGSREFSFGKNDLALIDEDGDGEEGKEQTLREFKDLGIEDEAVLSSPLDLNGNLEEHYERMVREDPSNPLFLRNYAQILLAKGDFAGAENFYLRAVVANPKDAEILLQYGKLVWALHHDRDKALKYFKRAACAAPEDSDVLAAYASFLWDIDEGEEGSSSADDDRQVEEFGAQVDQFDTSFVEEKRPASPPLHLATGLGINAAGFEGMVGSADYVTPDNVESLDVEDRYKTMIEENPCNPLILKSYARFLHETKGDLQEAEEYYSRAIKIDPTDGEVIMQYARLLWQLHSDRREALPYFKQAVEAAPRNSDVVAAYARFLWETEEDDEEEDIMGVGQ